MRFTWQGNSTFHNAAYHHTMKIMQFYLIKSGLQHITDSLHRLEAALGTMTVVPLLQPSSRSHFIEVIRCNVTPLSLVPEVLGRTSRTNLCVETQRSSFLPPTASSSQSDFLDEVTWDQGTESDTIE